MLNVRRCSIGVTLSYCKAISCTAMSVNSHLFLHVAAAYQVAYGLIRVSDATLTSTVW